MPLGERPMTNVRDIKFGEHRVERILILRRSGTDIVMFEFAKEVASPFPEMDKSEPGMYPPSFRIETRKGYAEEWLKLTFGVNPLDLDLVVRQG